MKRVFSTVVYVFSAILTTLITCLYCWFLLDTQQEVQLWIPSSDKQLNIVVFTWGTRGDIEPFIGVGQQLKEAGFNVTIAAVKHHRKFILDHGLHNYVMPNDDSDSLAATLLQQSAFEGNLYLAKYWGNLTLQWLDAWEKMPIKPDVILANYVVQGCAREFAKLFNIPIFIFAFMPYYPSTSMADFLFLEGELKDYGRFLNWLSYLPGKLIFSRHTIGPINQWLAAHNREPKSIFSFVSASEDRRHPVFLSHDPKLIPKPPDFPEWFINVGKLSRTKLPYKEEDYSACFDFINKNSNGTIYIGFGSMQGYNKTKFSILMGQMLKEFNLSAILLEKSFDMETVKAHWVPGSFLALPDVPHSKVFPHMKWVIHQCGSGHTSESLKTNSLTLCFPFFGEQLVWAKRLTRIHAGHYIPYQEIENTDTQKAYLILYDKFINMLTLSSPQTNFGEWNGGKQVLDHMMKFLRLSNNQSSIYIK